MPGLAEQIQGFARRFFNIPSTQKSVAEMEAEFSRWAHDLEQDAPEMLRLGLTGTAEEIFQQLWQRFGPAETPTFPAPPTASIAGPASEVLQACATLGIPADGDLPKAEAAYRRRARVDHPDRGGRTGMLQRDAEAIKTLRAYWRQG